MARFDGGYDYASGQIAALAPLAPPSSFSRLEVRECASAQLKRAALPRRRRLRGPQGGGSGLKGQGKGRERKARGPPLHPILRHVDLRGAPVKERRTPDLQSVRALTGVNPSPSASPGNRSRWGGADLSYPTEGYRRMQGSTVQLVKRRSHPGACRGTSCAARAFSCTPAVLCCRSSSLGG